MCVKDLVIMGFILISMIIVTVIIVLLFMKLIFPNKSLTQSSQPVVRSTQVRGPTYKPQSVKGINMNFYVINLMTKMSVYNVSSVINAVQTHTTQNFAPIWGITSTYQLLDPGTFPTQEQILDGSTLIYLTDNIIGEASNFSAVASHWITMPPPEDVALGAGAQPSSLINNVPYIPIGVPIIIIPYGNSTYGIASRLNHDTAINILGIALSHEVFETMANPFATQYGGNFQVLVGKEETIMYVREITDPTENQSPPLVQNIKMSNFVTPDYFNLYASEGTRMDFANLITRPMTPFDGNQYGLLFNNRGEIILFVDTAINNAVTRHRVSNLSTPRNISTLKIAKSVIIKLSTMPRNIFPL